MRTFYRLRGSRVEPRRRACAAIDGVLQAAYHSRGTAASFWRIYRLCFENGFRGPGTQLVVSVAPSRRKEPFSDRSWMDLAACKERRRMELTLGHHGAILNLAAAELRADIPFGARITLRCPWILAGVIPCL